MLRTVLLVNALAALALLARNRSWDTLPLDAAEMAARVEPALILSLLLLYLTAPLFARLRARSGWALTGVVALGSVLATTALGGWDVDSLPSWPVREVVWALLAAAAVMTYFTVQERALGPGHRPGAADGAVGADPAALPVQQPERRARHHARGPAPGRARAGGAVRPVPRADGARTAIWSRWATNWRCAASTSRWRRCAWATAWASAGRPTAARLTHGYRR